MGGYIQGGGHSPLSSLYGMAADHVLSYSVVLASGKFVTASPTSNPDIFWALRGGGGSTFGIVTSVTVKAYPDIPVTGTTFAFGVSETVSYDAFWAGVRSFFDYFITLSDAGTYSYFFVLPGTAPVFSMQPFFAPNLSIEATQTLLAPWFADLATLNISVSPKFHHYSTFASAWSASFPQEGIGMDNTITGSRLFPRSNWLDLASLNATFDAWKTSVDEGALTINFNFAPRYYGLGEDPTAVNPAWRETIMHAIQGVTWNENATDAEIVSGRQQLTDRGRAWRTVSPGAGAYLGESDREEENFQQSFYGYKYERLLNIKDTVDPWSVFWAKTAVGSDRWAVKTNSVVGDENGVLCKVTS